VLLDSNVSALIVAIGHLAETISTSGILDTANGIVFAI
jgi:hypothetical protein